MKRKPDTKTHEAAPKAAARRKPGVRAESAAPSRVCAAYYVNNDIGSQARLALAIRSLLRHTDDSLDVVVLCDSYLPAVRAAIADDLGSRKYTEVYDMEETLGDLGIYARDWHRGNWPFGAIYRLGVPLHRAFSHYDRILWMDLDVLVSSDRVRELLALDLSGCEIRAATDVSWLQDRMPALYESMGPEYAERLKSVMGTDALARHYINSGVLLWNLPEIRKDLEWYRERLKMFWDLSKQGKFGYIDQDFINAMMRVRADLASCFNSIYTTGQHVKGVLTHYVGGQYKEFLGAALEEGILNCVKEA